MPLAVLPWVTYLALPVSVHPLLILLPSAALLGVAVCIARRRSRSTKRVVPRCRKAVARFRLIAAPEDRPFEHRAIRIPGERLDGNLRSPAQVRRHAIAALLPRCSSLRACSRRRCRCRRQRREREMLAAVTRQLELLDRLAERAPHRAAGAARYHFDYARLRADLQRVRAGVRDYLVPQRAQPRDPVPLAGDYTRSGAASDKEAPSP
jgi:RAQPRD family integrative conjugative element protein